MDANHEREKRLAQRNFERTAVALEVAKRDLQRREREHSVAKRILEYFAYEPGDLVHYKEIYRGAVESEFDAILGNHANDGSWQLLNPTTKEVIMNNAWQRYFEKVKHDNT